MNLKKFGKSLLVHGKSGQALVEYALILVMVAILFGVTLAATGPAIGNVFSNTVFNLLGQDPRDVELLAEGRGNRDAFWATVEWIENNPPQEAPIPNNPPIPPPPGPTPGPSPTNTPETPTLTPSNTPTLGPTATPTDFEHIAPWLDTIDHPEWWRVDTSVYLGGDEWLGQYFANKELSGSPIFERYNGLLGQEYRWDVNFTWPSGTGPIEGWLTDNFSIRYTRKIYVAGTNPIQVRFTSRAGDGTRLWLNYAAGCAGVNSGGPATGSNRVYTDADNDGGSAAACLIIDNWADQTAGVQSVIRTLQPGFHTLQLDYYEATGDAAIRLDVTGITSRTRGDDTIPTGGTTNCNWTRSDTTRSNSKSFIWEENSNNQEFPTNMRCYLELRGSIDFSPLTAPKLIFWDVWDQGAGTTTWVEIGEYKADPLQQTWTRINLRAASTTNYNWTRNTIDLTSYVSGWATKKLALRFGMENNNTSATRRRWYVDDIEVRDFSNNNRFFTVCTVSQASCGSYWNLNNVSQKADFITSGRWDINGENRRGGAGSSWSDSPGESYVNNSEGTTASPRIHFVELNGWVDLTGATIPDADGDDGPPQLSFYHAYDLGRRTTLDLQWTRDQADLTPDNWQSIQILVPYNSSNAQTNLTMQLKEIPLAAIPNWNTQPFRLRFAMLVPSDANLSGGWWIDDIYLERIGRPRFADYPFSDDAESGPSKWLMEGQWSNTNEVPGLFDSNNVFTDSPGANYTHNTNASMGMRYPIDLNNDSPENLAPESDNIQTGPATRPTLIFWHWRSLQSSDNLVVEWSKDRGLTWTTTWAYFYAASTRNQRAWERIEVDLSALQAGTAATADKYDDDILIRFRLDARNNSSVSDGVYIDNISIANYAEVAHKLWDPSVSTAYGTGDNIRYSDDIDSGSWNTRWYNGGGWGNVDYDPRSRIQSLHESGPRNTNTAQTTYNVLQQTRIIDMRGITLTDRPTLYFWNHYDIGSNNTINVEVSAENTSYVRAAGETNYQRVTGWDDWVNVWSRPSSSRVDTWIREQISLDSYAGRRIKIRFVFNAYSGTSNRDGWYIDDVSVEQRKPSPIVLPFYDPAQSMTNWIGEGTWGLAPDQWRGSGGGPASLGTSYWQGTYYDCQLVFATVRPGNRNCSSTSDFNLLLYQDFAGNVQRAYNPATDLQETALDIYRDFRSTGRPPGHGGNSTWDDQYAARWVRDITVQAGDYTFISITDDGVRLKWETLPLPAPTCGTSSACWNIINNWTFHGRFVDIGKVNFAAGNYRLTFEWFESTGDATVILSAGKNNFSFGDSPKGGNGPTFPVVNSIPNGNSSLILRRPLRLTGTTRPVLEFWTRYRLGGTTYVEVSINGGFDWTTSNLTSSTGGWSCPSFYTCNTSYSGAYPSNFGQGTTSNPDNPADWQGHQNNLSNYVANNFVNLRFRLNTGTSVEDGVYITDIQVNAASIVAPTPTP